MVIVISGFGLACNSLGKARRDPEMDALMNPRLYFSDDWDVCCSTPDSPLKKAVMVSLASNGMDLTKALMAPFAKVSDVPADQIDAVIARLRGPEVEMNFDAAQARTDAMSTK